MNFHKEMPKLPKIRQRNRNRGPHTMELVISSEGITKIKSRAFFKDVCLILSKHGLGAVAQVWGTVPGITEISSRRPRKKKVKWAAYASNDI